MVSSCTGQNYRRMKSKSFSKKAQIKNTPAPAPNPEGSQGEAIPPGLKFVAELKKKTNAQAIADVFPAFADSLARGDIKQIEAAAGFLSGFGLDLGVPIPEWAKAASRGFWEGNGFDFLTEFQGQESQIGKMVGLFDLAANPSKPDQAVQVLSKQAKQGVFAIAKLEKMEAVNSSPEKHFEFAKGRKEASEIVEKNQGMSQRTKIYGIIAQCWREVEKFESTEDLYLWLMTLKNPDGNCTIIPKTKSREIRKICNIINLKFANQWTSPKQKAKSRPHRKT
jgi:hypothetical protein